MHEFESLDDVLQYLIDEEFIYDEDENGFNMSQGEYSAIAAYMCECIDDALYGIYDFEDALKVYFDFVTSAGDDALMFTTLTEEEADPCYWEDEDEETGIEYIKVSDPDELYPRLRELYDEYMERINEEIEDKRCELEMSAAD